MATSTSRVFEFFFLFFIISILITFCCCSSGLSPVKDYEHQELKREEEQIFHLSNRVLEATRHDVIDLSRRADPSTPITIHVTSPAVVTVPSTNPVLVTPNSTGNTVTVPSATPVPVTNPVTNSTPPGGVPVATPGTTPVAPPATTNAPAVPGQSWCVAKGGIQETALQAALDYACGTGGVDCSAIQQSGSCYNPNTLQNHASYAFNSYYQKNPVQTSCDFGGAAMIININPSTGSCIFPTSASSLPSPVTGNSTPASPASPVTVNPTPPTSVSPTPVTQNPTPASPTPPSSSGAGVPGAGSPPFVLNSSSPTSGDTSSGFTDSSSGFNSSTSKTGSLQPFISCIVLVTSIITGKLF